MAATYTIDRSKAFHSLSGDTRPVGQLPGALLYESDTTQWFIFDGSSWVAFGGPAPFSLEAANLAAQGLLTQNLDRQQLTTGSITINGRVYAMLIPVRPGMVLTSAAIECTVAGADMTLGKVGLYSLAGARLAASASQTTAWETSGLKEIDFAVPYTVPAGVTALYGVILATATTTLPTFLRGLPASVDLTAVTGGSLPAATESSQTDLDATATFIAGNSIAYWMGLL